MAKEKPSPPYVTFGAFLNFVASLKANGLPGEIDRTLMSSLSGAGQSELIAALRYLDLIENRGKTKPLFKELVDAHGTDTWASALGKVIDQAYGKVILGLDIEKETSKSLDNKFREAGVPQGQMLDRCVRFYIKALSEAKVKYSSYFSKRKGSLGSTSRKTNSNKKLRNKNRGSGGGSSTNTDGGIPPGSIALPLGGDRVVYVPSDITPDEQRALSAMIEAYATLNAGKDEDFDSE